MPAPSSLREARATPMTSWPPLAEGQPGTESAWPRVPQPPTPGVHKGVLRGRQQLSHVTAEKTESPGGGRLRAPPPASRLTLHAQDDSEPTGFSASILPVWCVCLSFRSVNIAMPNVRTCKARRFYEVCN